MYAKSYVFQDSHWVDSPENQCEASDGTVESLGLAVLACNSSTTIEGKLVDNDEVGNASPGVPSPLLPIIVTEGSKEAGQDHN